MSRKPAMSRMPTALLVASAMLAAFTVRESCAAEVPVVTKLKVVGKFTAPNTEKKPEKMKARGISGMACLGVAADGSRECFVINDEERFGQIAILTRDGFIADGKTIDFVKKNEDGKNVLGKARVPKCNIADKFDELDGEGVAIAGDLVYVASSHACSGGGEYKPSSYLLARFKANNASSFKGASEPVVERSWRLADVLDASAQLKPAFGMPKEQGTNIEGIAVIGDRLYAGMRTPLGPGSDQAFIVSAVVENLFVPDGEPLRDGKVETISVKLGANAGIRDLAALRNGGLLILSGPAHDEADVPYKLWLLEKPVKDAVPKPLATVTTSTPGKKKNEIAKAETVTVLEETADKLKLLVMYDNIDEGEPTLYDISLR